MPLTRRRYSLRRVLGIDVCDYNIQNCCKVAAVRPFLLYSFRRLAVGFEAAAIHCGQDRGSGRWPVVSGRWFGGQCLYAGSGVLEYWSIG
jgi:hypothetical protein